MQPATSPEAADLAARVRALTPMLADADPRVRKSAVIALGRVACPEATQSLCKLLGDPVEGVRVLACQALGRAADPASIPCLLGYVHDSSVEVRAGVLWALANVIAHGKLDTKAQSSLFSPIVVLAFDPDDGVRADAAAVLGTLHDSRATDALTVLLEDACARVRANACASLGLLDDVIGFEALLHVAQNLNEEPLVLVSALDGLARRAGRGSIATESSEAHAAVQAACTAAHGGQAGIKCAAEGNHQANATDGTTLADVRATALWALGYLVPLAPKCRKEAQDCLANALGSDDPWACRYAIEALARIHDDEARGCIEQCDAHGDHETERVRKEALATFGQDVFM